jgi:hypothetical protein
VGIESAGMIRLYRRLGFEATIIGPAQRYWDEERYPVRFDPVDAVTADPHAPCSGDRRVDASRVIRGDAWWRRGEPSNKRIFCGRTCWPTPIPFLRTSVPAKEACRPQPAAGTGCSAMPRSIFVLRDARFSVERLLILSERAYRFGATEKVRAEVGDRRPDSARDASSTRTLPSTRGYDGVVQRSSRPPMRVAPCAHRQDRRRVARGRRAAGGLDVIAHWRRRCRRS